MADGEFVKLQHVHNSMLNDQINSIEIFYNAKTHRSHATQNNVTQISDLRYLWNGTAKQIWSLVDTSTHQKAAIRSTADCYPVE